MRFSSHNLKSDGTVWVFGNDVLGQLGIGSNILYNTIPTQVPDINDAIYISAGVFTSALVRSNGKVYTSGANQQGQLGIGNLIDSNVFVEMIGVTNAIMVSCSAHVMVLKSDGTVVGCGYNGSGELGDGTNIDKSIAVSAIGITDAIFVACGFLSTIVLRSNKTLLSFGDNSFGQLGIGSLINSNVPVPVPGLTNVSCVSCGGYHVLALKTDGTVFAFGNNTSGQLGDGTTNNSSVPIQIPGINNAISVTGGGGDINDSPGFTMILKADGTIITVGNNTNGQLGNGTNTNSLTFVNVVLNAGQTGAKIFDALIGGVFCVREGSMVNTSRGRIPIEEVVKGDVVFKLNGQGVSVIYNIKMLEKTNKFIKIDKNALRENSPSQDLFIVKGHPILFRGSQWFPEQLSKRISGTSEIETEQFYYVYCLCTIESLLILIMCSFVQDLKKRGMT
jgi:alpha-tubulin suppressor-like RCC1 family protein